MENHPALRTIEQLLLITCLAFCTWLDSRTRACPNPLYDHYIKTNMRRLEQKVRLESHGANRDCVVWVALVLRATTAENSEPWWWALSVLRTVGEEKSEGEVLQYLVRIQEEFLPLPNRAVSVVTL
jgi:hypothetical protein